MKKKICAILLVMAVQMPVWAGSYIDKQLKEAKKNQKYQTIQTQIQKHIINKPVLNPSIELKDPKLISLSDVPNVDASSYKLKCAKDEQIYKNKIYPYLSKKDVSTVNIQPSPVDFYNIYRIAEKIIRANNLDYVNWRIAVRKSADMNAGAGDANYIEINTGIYDSFYSNPDALAFIISHEISHLLLGHAQRKEEMVYRLRRAYKAGIMGAATYSPNLGGVAYTIQKKRLMYETRKMEDMADVLGAELMTRAGYNMENAMEVLNTFDNLPEADRWLAKLDSSHPYARDRIDSVNENRALFPDGVWKNEGEFNILNSNVLECKKSSDRVSIIITKSPSVQKAFELEPINKKILRIAYMNYKNGNMQNAIKYFKKLNDIEPSYVNYLYLSYANEYLYKQTKDEKYLNESRKDIQNAKQINPADENVDKQINAL